jgi:hypothetical protein
LGDIIGDNGKVIVADKAYITKELAEKLKKELSLKEIEVRGYLT